MKTIDDLKFGFECSLGLDDREYTLEEVLQRVDMAMLKDHNDYARLMQETRQYRILRNRIIYELKDVQRYCEIAHDSNLPYMRGRRDTLEILLKNIDEWLQDYVDHRVITYEA